jgi:ferric-dicitrate binding protein FerR (iron transport regulator)
MFLESRNHIVLASIGCLVVFFLPARHAAGEQPLGRVVHSYATSLRGAPVRGSETIVAGDVLTTSGEGSALVELQTGTRVRIAESTSVRFLRDGENVRAELFSGSVLSESVGKPTLTVSTPTHQFVPAQETESRYAVQLSKEKTAIAAALKGNIIVKGNDTEGSYTLREGTYAAIPPWAAEVPDQSTAPAGQSDPERAGTVAGLIPDGTVQRRGQGPQVALKVDGAVGWEDVLRTSQNGRIRIALSDGSFLNLGSGSTLRVVGNHPEGQRFQIELTSGVMRVWVAKLAQTSSDFKVQTPTAATTALGSDFIIEPHPEVTSVYCIEGSISVRNVDATLAGQVVLHAGELTTIARGLPPSAPVRAADTLLQAEVSQTVLPPPSGRRRAAAGALPGWHIGSLSEAESIGLLVGLGAAGAAAVAIPLATAGPSSSYKP